jgi:hypothetical protein
MRITNLWIRACFILHNIVTGDLHDEEFLEGSDRDALEREWSGQAAEHHRTVSNIQTRIASDGGTTSGTHTVGQPLFRHALLEEAKERQWKPAYSN